MSEGQRRSAARLENLDRRRIELPADRSLVLECHCELIYESDTPWARSSSYERYRAKWLSTPQPDQFLASIEGSLSDSRTIADLWFAGDEAVAYLWLTFGEFGGYGISFAEVNEIWVVRNRRQLGLGSDLLDLAELTAGQAGASVLRWSAGIENAASQALVTSHGFAPVQILYEKLLVQPPINP